jgi:UDP-N-acetylglucosamine 4,6-dehydratase
MLYKNKKILVIGGTGTIGYHLVKALLQKEPAVIRIFSRDEYKQHVMQLDFADHREKLRFLIGDVRDYRRLVRAMEDIDYVFHLAAMKHVPFCEYNPFEAVQTNVIGTQNVILAAIQQKVEKVLFTSTDKAISPTNTYGATKLMGERLISSAEYQKGPKSTIFSSVRFGNVMGSRGSVIPLFTKQILERGEITVTDMDMIRYMMTSTQAIQLMLKANELSLGGEVFVFKMPVVKLYDLVEVVIEEVKRAYHLDKEIRVKVTGLRAGEKMYEELMTREEGEHAFEIDDMYIIPSIFWDHSDEYKKLRGENTAVNVYADVHLETPIDKETLRSWILEQQLISHE